MGDSAARLKTKSSHHIDVMARAAALLSVVEVGLGSLLHGLKIPFSGHFLSLNQNFFLTYILWQNRQRAGAKTLGMGISNIAALLKSLSPAGKKLTPMLAISAQGLLHGLGPLLFGVNYLGLMVGVALSCLWSFIQPLMIYYFLFGDALVEIGQYYLQKLSPIIAVSGRDLLWVLGIMASIKVVLGWALVVVATRLKREAFDTYEKKLKSYARQKKTRARGLAIEKSGHAGALLGAFKDLKQPLFLFSWGLTCFFFLFSKSSLAPSIWVALRPIVLAFVLFYLVRITPFASLAQLMTRGPFAQFGHSFKKTLENLKKGG